MPLSESVTTMTEHVHQLSLGFASVAAVNQYLRMASDKGHDCNPALQAAGLQTKDLEDPAGFIKGEQFQTLLYHLIRISQDPLLGLNSGQYVHPGSYNVLGFIIMSCATLKEAVSLIAPYEKVVGDMGVTTLEPWQNGKNEQIAIRWHCQYPEPLVRPHMVDNVFASWVHFSRWLADQSEAAPLKVLLERPRPEVEYLAAYNGFFRCPVLFDQPFNALIVDESLLNTALRQPDLNLRKTLEQHASQKILSLNEEIALSVRVRDEIKHQLEMGLTRQDMVAEALGMTSRTLQRRLGEENSSYQTILDEVRQEVAKSLLSHSEKSISEIAISLGFIEPMYSSAA